MTQASTLTRLTAPIDGRKQCPKSDVCLLRNIPLLRHVSSTEWQRFRQWASVQVYHPRNILFYQGNLPLGLHFMCRGRVKLTKEGRAGRSQIVRIVQAPDLLGDRSFFAKKPYACTGEVMEESHICFLETRHFEDIFGQNLEMLRLLTQRFAIELGRSEEYISCMAACTVLARLATRILKLWEPLSLKTSVPPRELTLPETRIELSQILGTTPEAVSRALAQLRAKGLIAVSGQRVRILNENRLRLCACSHAAPN